MYNLQEIIKRLQSQNAEERKQAAYDLRMFAATGADISLAFPAIEQALSDKEQGIRQNIIWALLNTVNHHDISLALQILIKALEDNDSTVRARAVGALRNASNTKQNVLPALPALVKALKDADTEVRREASAAFTNITWYYDYNISLFLPALILSLKDPDTEVRDSTCRAFSNWAYKGKDITPAITALKKIIENKDENSGVKVNAAGALVYHYLNGGDAKAVAELLKNEDNDVKRSVTWGAGYHYANKKEWKKIEELLKNKDNSIIFNVCSAILVAQNEGIDVSPILPLIKKTLG